jgi:hypothetical protein
VGSGLLPLLFAIHAVRLVPPMAHPHTHDDQKTEGEEQVIDLHLEDAKTLPGDGWTVAEDEIVALELPLRQIMLRLREAGYWRTLYSLSRRRCWLRKQGVAVSDVRGRVVNPEQAIAMVGDYQTGMTVAGVAAKYRVSVSAVYYRLKAAGVPLRKTNRGQSREVLLAMGAVVNAARVKAVGQRQAALAAAVLADRPPANPADVQCLQLRVEHPYASLRELGAMAGLTKHAFAGRLRRALQ